MRQRPARRSIGGEREVSADGDETAQIVPMRPCLEAWIGASCLPSFQVGGTPPSARSDSSSSSLGAAAAVPGWILQSLGGGEVWAGLGFTRPRFPGLGALLSFWGDVAVWSTASTRRRPLAQRCWSPGCGRAVCGLARLASRSAVLVAWTYQRDRVATEVCHLMQRAGPGSRPSAYPGTAPRSESQCHLSAPRT